MALTAQGQRRAAFAPPSAAGGAALAALSVLALASAQGGYLPSAWRLGAVALAGAGALVRLWSPAVRLNRPALALVAVPAAFALLSLLSAAWSIDPAASVLDTQRTLLYTVALAAFVLAGDGLVPGVLTGTTALGVWALGDRFLNGATVDRYEGTLLTGPLGYANGLGALMAIAIVVAAALALRDRRAWWLAPLPVCVPALLLTGSRAALAATVVGLAVASGRRRVAYAALAASGAALVAFLLFTPAWAGDRAHYWAAARTADLAGSGAGTFHELYSQVAPAHDAHSLYLQAWAELGLAGLLLALALAVFPLLYAVRRGRWAPAAGLAVFALHAGVDWDWQLPAVTVAALALAAAAVVEKPSR